MEKEENPDLLCTKSRQQVGGREGVSWNRSLGNDMFVVISYEELDFRTWLSVGFTSELVSSC